MRESRFGNNVRSTILMLASIGLLSGCHGSGDTDGGKGDDAASSGGAQYVADGGAGATIEITAPDTISVGEIDGFRVILKDPNGLPLSYVRVNCESEKGIAIIEPSSGGVAFEHTGPNGDMSGQIGGLTPGSYIMECRAPEGFGLTARHHLVVNGPVPAGFVGFPGAAGGNLGGGRLIDMTPDIDAENGAIRIAKVEFTDGSYTGPNGPIDIERQFCDAGTPAESDDDFWETLFYNEFSISITNGTNQVVYLNTVDMTVQNGIPSSITTLVMGDNHPKQVEIAPNSTGVVTGLLTEFSGGTKVFTGTSDAAAAGTYRVDIVVTATTSADTDVSIAESVTLTFGSVDRCGEAQ